MKDIELIYKGETYTIPNSWEALTQKQFIALVRDLARMAQGELAAGVVRIRHLCRIMDWKLKNFRTEEQVANLLALSEQLTFLFLIQYPDNNFALQGLSDADFQRCRRIDPFHLTLPIARALQRMDYQYTVDLCFAKQLLPEVHIKGKDYRAYTIDTTYNRITTSLTALQYIEAKELLDQGEETLPLLASILYYEGKYSSEKAHALAPLFAQLSRETLLAISFCFQAFSNYLFSKTSFSLLTKFEEKPLRPITTDAADALYDLSQEGLGNAQEIEQMPLITYLKVLRKKTISAVKDMSGFGYDKAKISTEVGLPISIINKIL
ncbi:hypothetical protein [Prevotella disiens]|nr:hypothetical protein [Prevotella disiens]